MSIAARQYAAEGFSDTVAMCAHSADPWYRDVGAAIRSSDAARS